MYKIKIFDGPEDAKGTVIHSPYVNDKKVSWKANLVLDGVSDLEFTIKPNNPGWNKIRPLNTLIELMNVKTKKVLFKGRVLQPEQSMNSDGMFSIKYVCEGEKAYLNDSNQRYGKYQNVTIESFYGSILGHHNQTVEPYKHFKVGNVTVTDPNDSIYRYLGYETTFATLQDKLLDRLGGHLVVREEPDGTYLDYLKDVGEISKTKIKLRTNLKDLRREIDPTEIITRVVVLGSKLSDEEGNDERLTMKSVNNGLDYLDNPALIAEFGIIEGVLTYDDINTPSTLKLRGEQFFASQAAAKVSYDITPLDLSTIDTNFDSFTVGNWYYVVNEVFGINELLQIIEISINGDNPHLSKITMGEKRRTLSQYQAEANKKMQTYDQLQSRVDSLSASNMEFKEQLRVASEDLQAIQTSLGTVDIDSLPEELQGISAQILGLRQTIDDLVIPEYSLATSTTNGLMSSIDKTKLDGLQKYDLATETTTGLMSATDKVVVNSVGNKAMLKTTDQTTLVAAINELNERLKVLEP